MLEPAIEGAVADAEFLGGLAAIAVVTLEGFLKHRLAQVVQVQVLWFLLGLNVFLSHRIHDWTYMLHRRYGLKGRELGCWHGGRRDLLSLRLIEAFLQLAHLATHLVHVAAQFEEYLVEYLALVLKRVVTAVSTMDGGQLGGLLILRDEGAQHVGRDGALGAEHRDLAGDVLQLPDVAWPLVAHQHLLGLVGEHHLVHPVFLCHLHGEEPEQQHDILAPLTERRHLHGHLVQTVEQIFAETAFADGLLDIHVRGSDDAHIGLLHLCSTNGDILAILEHSQQPGLCSQGQFTHLIEEERAFVGCAEITR